MRVAHLSTFMPLLVCLQPHAHFSTAPPPDKCTAPSLECSRVYDALENAPRAVKWYRAALQADPFNYEVRC